MWTIKYRGCWISGHNIHHPVYRVTMPSGQVIGPFHYLAAARAYVDRA